MKCETKIIDIDSRDCSSAPHLQHSANGAAFGGFRFLCIAGAIAIGAGLLFPLPSHIFDVLLIFSLSLTAAVLIITFSARSALQVLGLPLLIVLLGCLRMALSVESAKLMLSQGSTGSIINLLVNFFLRNNCAFAILVFSVLGPVSLGAICKSVKVISRTATDFITDVVPVKQISIDRDLNSGLIDNSHAMNLREKITREAGFFAAMAGAAGFVLCAAVIELVIVIISTVGAIAVGIPAMAELKTYIILAVGSAIVAHTSLLITALASRYLVQRSFAANGEFVQPSAEVEGIEAVARVHVKSAEITNSAAGDDIQAEKKVITVNREWLDESRCAGNDNEKNDSSGTANAIKAVWEASHFAKDDNVAPEPGYGCDDYYESIAELIESKSGVQAKTILMAADSVAELPVTIPVNIAMRLAQKQRRCLLIDLDLQRDAISKVFDIDSGKAGNMAHTDVLPREIPSCVRNLWVWPASNFGKTDDCQSAINIKELIASLESRYDHLIIYAPNIKLWDSLDQIGLCEELNFFALPGSYSYLPIGRAEGKLAKHTNCAHLLLQHS